MANSADHHLRIQPHRKKGESHSIIVGDLIQNDEFESNIHKSSAFECPYVRIKIKDCQFEMLIDSGAEIGAVTTNYERQITDEMG